MRRRLVVSNCMWESVPWIEFLMALSLHSGRTSDGSKLVAVWLRELQVEMPLSCLWNGLKALRKGGGLQVSNLLLWKMYNKNAYREVKQSCALFS